MNSTDLDATMESEKLTSVLRSFGEACYALSIAAFVVTAPVSFRTY